MPDAYVKDSSAKLDYVFSWQPWLETAEVITDIEMTVPAGLTKVSEEITGNGKLVTVWLSGGTAGEDYKVSCRITTSAGRIDERTMRIEVKER